jgi:chromosome segregation ATPase
MAKKRLTDLLREEVEKSPDINSATERKTNDDEDIEQNAEAVEKSPMNTPAKPNARRSVATKSTATKAELEATVAELKAALEEAQKKETSFADLKESLEESHRKEKALQKQITELQAELHNQNESLQKLQKNLEKIADLKTEFDQAKKAAVQLAEANEKLTQEINALKKENESLTVEEHRMQEPMPGRPIQKENERPADFAKTSWLL